MLPWNYFIHELHHNSDDLINIFSTYKHGYMLLFFSLNPFEYREKINKILFQFYQQFTSSLLINIHPKMQKRNDWQLL